MFGHLLTPGRRRGRLESRDKLTLFEKGPVTITIEIRPEVEAELARQAALQGRAIEPYVASLLEEAADVSAERLPRRTGQALIDASARVRGLFTDEEVDTLFRRNPSPARPVDFE